MMLVEVTIIDDCSRKLKIKIPSEKVSQEYESLIKKVSSAVRIKGFRKGKAPRNLVKLHYKDSIESDLLKSIVPGACEEAMKNEDLDVVGSYLLEDYVFQEGDPLELVVTVEVKPQINLVNYKDIKIEKKEVKVEDDEVENEIKRLRDEHSELKPVEGRDAKAGDDIIFDFSWSIDGKENEVSEKESRVILGKNELLEELEKENKNASTISPKIKPLEFMTTVSNAINGNAIFFIFS